MRWSDWTCLRSKANISSNGSTRASSNVVLHLYKYYYVAAAAKRRYFEMIAMLVIQKAKPKMATLMCMANSSEIGIDAIKEGKCL